ncbi:MAG: divergent polysaccharide deacetylase family protein [Rhodospirillales bacterium]|nr:divergent polysaccharide deacetylase family protein [Rhodospirillales bacterium]
MKLPFKLPSIKLPKFGKKKTDEDDDDDDFDFDPSDFEGDPDASLGDAPESPAGEDDEHDAEASPASEPFADETSPAMEDEDSGANEGNVAAASDPGEEIEDIDFGDDDEDDDDDGDEKKAGLKSKLIEFKKQLDGNPKRKMMVIGGGAATALLLIGGLSWLVMSGGNEEEKAAEELSKIPKVALDIAPAPNTTGGTSLNAIAKGVVGPGAGIVVPVMVPSVFASVAQPTGPLSPLSFEIDPTLIEDSPQGPLPKIAQSGKMVWQAYAKPFENQDARPRIAIVISGLGQSEAATDAAIRLLPGNVTLAFDPYAPGLLDWSAKARAAGHEVMIMMPLEPATFPNDDPGPQGLMTTNAAEENRLRLEYVLSRMNGYMGVMTVMGSKFNTSDEHVRAFLEEIRGRGLMFLEGGINEESLGPKIATEIGLPRALTDLVIDTIPTRDAIDTQLAELEGILNNQPAAVAIAEAYPSSIERIAVWAAGLEAKNFVLAPLSALADKQFLQ